MADKQLAYDTRGKNDLFADDDPLAELARIVGFEPRVAANTVTETARQEPAFDLEDELLREFERYDSPRPLAALDHPAEPAVEQSVAYEPAGYDHVEPAQDIVSPHEDVPADIEAPMASVAVAPQPAAQEWDALASADWTAGPVHVAPAAVFAAEPVQPIPSSGGARDLIEELELSIGASSAPMMPAKVPQWSAASIRLPLANFHAARREEAAAPEPAIEQKSPVIAVESVATIIPLSVAAPVVEDQAFESLGFPAEMDRHYEPKAEQDFAAAEEQQPQSTIVAGFDLVAAAAEGVDADAALTEAPADTADVRLDLDDLLADIQRYPVPQRPVSASPQVVVSEAPRSRATPVAPVAPAYEPPAYVAPVQRAEPEPPVMARPVAEPQPAAVAAKVPVFDADDPFAGHDFELDLAGIELELADLDFSEPAAPVTPVPQPQMRPQPQPTAPQPAPVQYHAQASVQPQAQQWVPSQPAAPVAVSQPAYRPQPAPAYVPQPAAPVVENTSGNDLDDLPFDPSMISDPEDRPEAVEMHVPTLPPVEQPTPVAKAPDYDFDLDAEIASFFDPAKQPESPAAPAWGAAKPAARQPVAADGLDDFERALEEDFRRSVREPVQRHDPMSEVHIESASEAADFSRARSMKRMLAAAAVCVVFAGGAYAAYTWAVSHGSGIGFVASGEPRVIVADKEPVKVVPENPGGKTVPNQDKAVYDQVAGSKEAPKQKALVSSAEEPVDVVQKTLTPEALPEDSDPNPTDDQIMPTAVGDTQDPRLLPNQETADNATASDADKAPAVSPRKVRTMIVKPDGTLVARDEPAPAETKPVVQPAKIPQATTTPNQGSAASFPAATEVASADIRPATPVQTTEIKPSPLAQAAQASAVNPADVDPPIRSVKTTTITDMAAKPDIAPKTDTAPIPSARPVEQPVNVVGTVTENGNVRPTTVPKTTQVASATPVSAQPQPTSASSGGYGLQIASLPSEDEAKKSYASLSKKFGGVLSGRAYEIRKADIAGKGTFYRVRIPAGSKDEAAALCEQYRSAGGSCLISK